MLWRYVLPVAGGLALVLLACLLPDRFLRGLLRLALNAAAGCALLAVVNTCTGISLPLNALTLAVGGLLGAPGIAAAAALAAI